MAKNYVNSKNKTDASSFCVGSSSHLDPAELFIFYFPPHYCVVSFFGRSPHLGHLVTGSNDAECVSKAFSHPHLGHETSYSIQRTHFLAPQLGQRSRKCPGILGSFGPGGPMVCMPLCPHSGQVYPASQWPQRPSS